MRKATPRRRVLRLRTDRYGQTVTTPRFYSHTHAHIQTFSPTFHPPRCEPGAPLCEYHAARHAVSHSASITLPATLRVSTRRATRRVSACHSTRIHYASHPASLCLPLYAYPLCEPPCESLPATLRISTRHSASHRPLCEPPAALRATLRAHPPRCEPTRHAASPPATRRAHPPRGEPPATLPAPRPAASFVGLPFPRSQSITMTTGTWSRLRAWV